MWIVYNTNVNPNVKNMHAPLASTITLIMELIIGFLIFFIIFQGWKHNRFSKKLTFFAIGYEIIFNVGYMIYRSVSVSSTTHLSSAMKIFAMMHGILSLVMLFVVVAFFLRATREYGNNINSFVIHRSQTMFFLFFWLISLLSGVYIYVTLYF